MIKYEALSFPPHMMPKSTAEADFFKAAILAAIPAAMAQGFKEGQLDLESEKEPHPWRMLELGQEYPESFDAEAKAALMMAMAVLENYRAANFE